MIPTPVPTPDDRAVATAVTNVLAIAITGILVSGLLLGISSFTEGQQEGAVRDQLETVGSRLADEHTRVSELASRGGNVSITTKHPDQVGGTRYSVSIVNNSATECDARLVPGGVEDCLELEAQDPDVTVYLPLRETGNATVSIRDLGGGSFRLTASTNGSTAAADRAPVTPDTQVGVGQNAQGSSLTGGLQTLNKPPQPDFEVSPPVPRSDVPTEFDARDSSDAGGSIVSYEWDFDGDGSFEATGEQATKSLGPGRHRVTLQVTDDDATTATLSKNVSVSGLNYEEDLMTTGRTGGPIGDDTIKFSVKNTWSRPIELSELFVDPADDSIDRLVDTSNYEVKIDTGDEVELDGDADIEPPGLIINLNQPEADSTPSGNQVIPANTVANITIGNFNKEIAGKRIDFAVDYIIDGGTNTTTFTHVPSPVISDYNVVAAGQDVDMIFDSSQELDTITVDVDGPVSKTLTRSDFTETVSGSTYTYQADVSSGTDGTFYANLTGAQSNSVGSSSPPINKSVVTSGAGYVWKTQIDWDSNQDETGVVHDSFGDRPGEDVIRLGYPASDRGGSNLVGYWTFDEDSGDTVADVTGNGNDAERRGEGNTQDSKNTPTRGVPGLHGTSSWSFNTDTSGPPEEDAVYVGSDSRLEGGPGTELTATAWINPDGGVQNDDASIVGKEEGLSNGDWGLIVEENCPSWGACDGSPTYIGYYGENGNGDYGLYEETGFSNGWHHVAMVLDEPDDEVSIYIDGTLVERDDNANEVTAQTNHPVEIGRTEYQGSWNGPGFEGKIDEVRIYDRTLNDSEIGNLHAAGEQGTFTTSVKSGPTVDPDNIELTWSGDIPSGTDVTVELWDPDDGEKNGEVTLTSDSGTTSAFNPGADSESNYYLVVELNSNSAGKTPEIDRLALREP